MMLLLCSLPLKLNLIMCSFFFFLYKIENTNSIIVKFKCIYVCEKVLPRDLNPGPYPLHPTRTLYIQSTNHYAKGGR